MMDPRSIPNRTIGFDDEWKVKEERKEKEETNVALSS